MNNKCTLIMMGNFKILIVNSYIRFEQKERQLACCDFTTYLDVLIIRPLTVVYHHLQIISGLCWIKRF